MQTEQQTIAPTEPVASVRHSHCRPFHRFGCPAEPAEHAEPTEPTEPGQPLEPGCPSGASNAGKASKAGIVCLAGGAGGSFKFAHDMQRPIIVRLNQPNRFVMCACAVPYFDRQMQGDRLNLSTCVSLVLATGCTSHTFSRPTHLLLIIFRLNQPCIW